MGGLFSALSPRESVVGLNLDSGLAVAAQAAIDRSGYPRLKKAAWCEYNPKASPDQIAAAIRRMWNKGGIGNFSVASCLHSRSMVLRHFQYNGISEDELASALQLEAEEALLASPEDVSFDWILNDDDSDDFESSLLSGTLVALPQAEINQHLDLLKRAALFPIAVGASCLATSSLFSLCRPNDDADTVCLTRVGTRSADIAVIYGRNAIYPRTVFVHASQAGNPARYFADSIKDVLSYCSFKLHLPDVKKLYLAGAVDESLKNEIEEASSTEVVEWNPLPDITGSGRLRSKIEGAPPEVQGALLAAIGLALESY
jgi:Tfp pilus assembly PilM family ATPase